MLTKVSSEIGALRWLTTVSKYNITLYFEGLRKQVSEIVLLYFADIQLPNFKGTGKCCYDIIINNHSNIVLWSFWRSSTKVCLLTPIFQMLFALKA